ncbi:MAG: hypothetical protein IJG37_02460 [Synergistaceae bacterium]|nr:hypothetical protein [Synergistaceae bacterium]
MLTDHSGLHVSFSRQARTTGYTAGGADELHRASRELLPSGGTTGHTAGNAGE